MLDITPCDDPRDCYYRDHYYGGKSGCRILNPRKSNGVYLPPYAPNKCSFYKPREEGNHAGSKEVIEPGKGD